MKPKYDKPLKHFTVRVTVDQFDFLQSLDNASEWLRRAIDAKMFEEITDVLAIVKRIEFLERKKSQIYNSEEYKVAKETIDAEFSSDYENYIQKEPEIKHQLGMFPIRFNVNYETKQIECRVYNKPLSHYFLPVDKLMSQNDLQDFIAQNNLKTEGFYGRNVALKLFDKLKEKIAYMRKVNEQYTLKIAEIQKEIDSLKDRLMKEA